MRSCFRHIRIRRINQLLDRPEEFQPIGNRFCTSWRRSFQMRSLGGGDHSETRCEIGNLEHFSMEGQEMDWNGLVRSALLGSSDLEQYAILLVRVSLGLFFAISGANKLFVAGSRQTMSRNAR